MWMVVVIFLVLGTINLLQCNDISSMSQYDSDGPEKHDWNKDMETDKSIEYILDKSGAETIDKSSEEISVISTTMEPKSIITEAHVNRRYWLVSSGTDIDPNDQLPAKENIEKDANIKSKITTLVEQTIHDTEKKIRSLHRLKQKLKDDVPYKIGFILSLVKKSKDVLNELFNVAVKHRDDYKALEELKIFEYIVHTNVDTTNLVRQMVELHIQYVNSSNPFVYRNRVVLLK